MELLQKLSVGNLGINFFFFFKCYSREHPNLLQITQDLGISVFLEQVNIIFITIIITVNSKSYIHISQIVWFDLGNDTNETTLS